MVLQPISLPSTAVTAADAVRLRRDRVDPVEAYARAQANLRAVFSDEAAVVQFGAQALSLARSSDTSNPDATAPDLFDTLDLELGLFAYEAPGPLESGFFRSTNAANTESLLAPQSLDGGLESTYPQASANTPRESPLAPNSDAILPRAPVDNGSETAFPGAPGADNTDAGLFGTLEANATGSSLGAANNRAATAPVTPFRTEGLSGQQQREIQTLAQNERLVRADEEARRAAAGGYANGVQLRYEVGPNGQRYVVAAEVPLDVTPVPGDPAATLRKMEVIIRAATSGSPSISDRTTAAEAEQLARRARAQLAAERYAKAQEF